jgi:hypothetical protein
MQEMVCLHGRRPIGAKKVELYGWPRVTKIQSYFTTMQTRGRLITLHGESTKRMD